MCVCMCVIAEPEMKSTVIGRVWERENNNKKMVRMEQAKAKIRTWEREREMNAHKYHHQYLYTACLHES